MAADKTLETTMAQDQALAARIDKAMDAALDEGRIVGGVVLVARDGETVYARAAGLADRETGRPVGRDTIFRYASLTKPMVSAATLALAEEGVIDLDAQVTRYLPDFRPKLADGTEPVITLRHLLTHTSGLTYDFMEPPESAYHAQGISNGFDRVGVAMADNLKSIAAWPLNFAPGSAWTYSVSTDVLGAVLAAATGKSLGEIVRDKVTGPLGLIDTGFKVTDPERLSVAYANAEGGPVAMGDGHQVPFAGSPLIYAPSRAFHGDSFESGGAGMVGTADDYLKFLETIRTGGGAILKPQTTQLLLENAIGEVPVAILGPGSGFSLGGAILRDPAATGTPQAAGTWSWGGVYGGSWFVDPANALTVVVLTNTAIEGMGGVLPGDVRAAVYAA
jgi:CubicO group peptidase (beta-lactamase class C family)